MILHEISITLSSKVLQMTSGHRAQQRVALASCEPCALPQGTAHSDGVFNDSYTKRGGHIHILTFRE